MILAVSVLHTPSVSLCWFRPGAQASQPKDVPGRLNCSHRSNPAKDLQS